MKRRYIMMLATSAAVGSRFRRRCEPWRSVSPDGTYYKPSFPANKPPTTVPACPIDACHYTDGTDVYQDPLWSAIAKLEPFTIEAGNTEIDVENLDVSFSCVDPRQEDVEDCEDQAWDAYQAALNGTHSKPGPWSDFTGAWEDYQDALAACQSLLNGPWAGYSSVEIEGDLSSGNSEGSIEVTAKLEIDLSTTWADGSAFGDRCSGAGRQ